MIEYEADLGIGDEKVIRVSRKVAGWADSRI
jgi:hypothetical protein